jgi:diaminohydroxyphosphoribosylaminopyrimidine deaminase/5-amino-6-(5-phosphoribosylamino)uracil reductase
MRHDEVYMKRAIELAEFGRGLVEPNPLVGAVLVHDGRIVGEGFHHGFGDHHAEVDAFFDANLRNGGRVPRDNTLYVTLEPCCHHGKTPPCTDAIIAAGVRRVVAAMLDPFPQVAGQGVARLRDAGIMVEVGLLENEARELNAPYLKLLSRGRPYVQAKWAMTLDGKIATRAGASKWISNETSRELVHRTRSLMDGIVVGIGTVLADDPGLTARGIDVPRIATRIVLDSRARLPLSSQLVRSAKRIPTLVAVSNAGNSAAEPLRAAGCEVLVLPGEVRPDVTALLDELGRRRMTNILVEGGSEVLGSFLDADAIDEFHIFIAPILVGGKEARPATGGSGVANMADALRLAQWENKTIDGDIYIHGCRR